MTGCHFCGKSTTKVIYLGLPGNMCFDCCALTGLAAYAPKIETETDDGPAFKFMPYTGSYWLALWRWLFNPPTDPPAGIA
jgi:hypothetical protein